MKGYRINKNKQYVDLIVEGLMKRDGHCPCRKTIDESTLCPCDDFLKTGVCKCKLFIKDNEE